MSNYEILNQLESTGQLKQLVHSGIMPVKICAHLEIYRLVDMRIKTGTMTKDAVIEASDAFNICERSVFRIIRGLKK